MIALYHNGRSLLHRAEPGAKLLALALGGTMLFQLDGLAPMGAALALVIALYAAARIPPRVAWHQLRPALLLLALIFATQSFLVGVEPAAVIVIRFGVLILAAALMTLTTRVADMIAGIQRGLSPFGRWMPVAKISLAITMAIRFIPLISGLVHEVREAQRVRGLERSILAVAMPVIVRTLKMGNEIGEALDARSFGNAEPAARKARR
jgi:biotin transport system permease protein